jgi:predicted RNA-binding protein with RPS1 domain
VLVEFGMEVRGLITGHQLFDQAGSTLDYRNKMLKSKFAIGAKVDVRVLSSDPTTKRCFVTAKKSLLQSSKIITSWDECKVGSFATGFISKVDDGGLFVTFFNRVFGRVPARSLALELGINDHRENYNVGDVVKCRVVNLKKVRRGSKGRRTSYSDDGGDDSDGDDSRYIRELTLSLRVHTAEEGDDDQMEEAEEASRRVHLRAGAVLPEKSMKVTSLIPGKQKDNGTFVPGHAIVSVKSKYLVDEAESATMLPYVECKLPYDQLLDHYELKDIESSASMDELAEKLLQLGKALKQKGILLSDPRKSSFEFSTGTGRLTIVSLRPKLVEKAEALFIPEGMVDPDSVMLPAPDSHLFDGAQVMGFVTHIDQRYGGFVRFLDGLTGLVPKGKGGLELELFSTVITRIVSVDNLSHPPKILLSASKESWKTSRSPKSPSQKGERPRFRRGTLVAEAKIDSFDFYNANLTVLDKEWDGLDVRARIHCTVAASDVFTLKKKKIKGKYTKATSITKYHPFSGWSEGQKLSNLYVIALHVEDGVHYVELTNREKMEEEQEEVEEEEEDGKTMRAKLPKIVSQEKKARPGWIVSVIVKQIAKNNGGICVSVGPKVTGFIPGLECSDDPEVLNDLGNHVAIGARLECMVIDEERWNKRKAQATDSFRNKKADSNISMGLYLSMRYDPSSKQPYEIAKPVRGDLVVGRVQRSLKQVNAPSLMLELRGGYVARCCISELEEMDEWSNMPLGHAGDIKTGKDAAIVSGESDADGDDDGERSSKHVNRRRCVNSSAKMNAPMERSRVLCLDCEIKLLELAQECKDRLVVRVEGHDVFQSCVAMNDRQQH